jgi:hypothetical protein
MGSSVLIIVSFFFGTNIFDSFTEELFLKFQTFYLCVFYRQKFIFFCNHSFEFLSIVLHSFFHSFSLLIRLALCHQESCSFLLYLIDNILVCASLISAYTSVGLIFIFLHFQHLSVLLFHLLIVLLLLLPPLFTLPLKLGLSLSYLLLVIFSHGFQSILTLLCLASFNPYGGHSQLCILFLQIVKLSF